MQIIVVGPYLLPVQRPQLFEDTYTLTILITVRSFSKHTVSSMLRPTEILLGSNTSSNNSSRRGGTHHEHCTSAVASSHVHLPLAFRRSHCIHKGSRASTFLTRLASRCGPSSNGVTVVAQQYIRPSPHLGRRLSCAATWAQGGPHPKFYLARAHVLVPRPCIEWLGTQYEWPATQFSEPAAGLQLRPCGSPVEAAGGYPRRLST